ncbi:hypothetical protein BDV96DRAFT_477831, partial [Lophiotrema nucula]
RMIRKGQKPHLSQLPPPLKANGLKSNHPMYRKFKEAEATHLESHKETQSWTEVPARKARE